MPVRGWRSPSSSVPCAIGTPRAKGGTASSPTPRPESGRWRRPSDVARFIDRRLAVAICDSEGRRWAGPDLTTVLTDMLAVLGARLPLPPPALPDPNVTLERITERLSGWATSVGPRSPVSSAGGRCAVGGCMRVRFQLGRERAGRGSAVLALQSELLQDREALRQAGFLRFNAADMMLAERVDSVNGWRKATSFDVLFEYQYVDTDDADSLIVRIPVGRQSG